MKIDRVSKNNNSINIDNRTKTDYVKRALNRTSRPFESSKYNTTNVYRQEKRAPPT